MNKMARNLKNYLLNRSNQFRYYKSQNNQLKKDLSSVQSAKQKLLKRIAELEKDRAHETKADFQEDADPHKKIRTKNLCKLENVSIGKYTYGNPLIKCYEPGDKLTIGNFCSIAQDVTILIGMNHCMSCTTTFPHRYLPGIRPMPQKPQSKASNKKRCEETIIGNDVWIGYGALVLSGVTIGDGAIIGARTVVSKDVEPYSVVVGSPMKHLRYRFSKEIRDILLEKKWWDLPDEKIKEITPYLTQPDIHKLIEKL